VHGSGRVFHVPFVGRFIRRNAVTLVEPFAEVDQPAPRGAEGKRGVAGAVGSGLTADRAPDHPTKHSRPWGAGSRSRRKFGNRPRSIRNLRGPYLSWTGTTKRGTHAAREASRKAVGGSGPVGTKRHAQETDLDEEGTRFEEHPRRLDALETIFEPLRTASPARASGSHGVEPRPDADETGLQRVERGSVARKIGPDGVERGLDRLETGSPSLETSLESVETSSRRREPRCPPQTSSLLRDATQPDGKEGVPSLPTRRRRSRRRRPRRPPHP
jgi:hypothetical protein